VKYVQSAHFQLAINSSAKISIFEKLNEDKYSIVATLTQRSSKASNRDRRTTIQPEEERRHTRES